MVRVQIKGGVWKNVSSIAPEQRGERRKTDTHRHARNPIRQTEDEILKAAISKYGMNVSTRRADELIANSS